MRELGKVDGRWQELSQIEVKACWLDNTLELASHNPANIQKARYLLVQQFDPAVGVYQAHHLVVMGPVTEAAKADEQLFILSNLESPRKSDAAVLAFQIHWGKGFVLERSILLVDSGRFSLHLQERFEVLARDPVDIDRGEHADLSFTQATNRIR
jgi:hypothetical protein